MSVPQGGESTMRPSWVRERQVTLYAVHCDLCEYRDEFKTLTTALQVRDTHNAHHNGGTPPCLDP